MEPELSAELWSFEQLIAAQASWRRLAAQAIEPNPFYAPAVLIPAIRAGSSPNATRFLVILNRSGEMQALWPLQKPALKDGFAGLVTTLYRDPLTCLTTPLVASHQAEAVIRRSIQAIGVESPVLLLPLTTEDGAFLAAMRQAIGASEPRSLESWSRPAIARSKGEDPLRHGSLARKLRQLEKQGSVQFSRVDGHEPEARQLYSAFLDMEMRSWKGEAGSALAQTPALSAVFEALLEPNEQSTRLFIEALLVDGIPAAINLNLVTARRGYSVKTAFGPEFSSASPGRLLDASSLGLCRDEGPLDWVDSCAGPGHPVSDLWDARQEMASLAVPIGSAGRLMLPFVCGLQAAIRQARRWRYSTAYTTRKVKRVA
jgi:CelD/BcsL family acetyltransferase involved in cellulose biosynthesis